ncbi:MAG: choice-of-anchor tandem repeat GloVer-containing protein [Candidatus Cybelea sp.]
MNILARCTLSLSISATAVVLAGCGGSQTLVGAPGAMAQTPGGASALTASHLDAASASYKVLYRFRRAAHPIAALINVNGTLYSTTYGAIDGLGGGGYGTVYSITTSGAHKLLYRFRGGADGHNPHGLVNVNGTLYGTTTFGGGYECNDSSGVGCGTVYSISTSGTEKALYAFKGSSDGAFPRAGLIDVNGTLYGTTSEGGSGCNSSGEEIGCGTVFSITASGQETVLYRFAGFPDGIYPAASLIDVNGTLYGTTIEGGSGCYSSHGLSGCGTVFAVTTSGRETVLHRFGSGDGVNPVGGLIDVNGTLYGTTSEGGTYYDGTVYSISTSDGETVLYSFGGEPANGAVPEAPLLNVSGTLYGTAIYGGRNGHGTVFALTP